MRMVMLLGAGASASAGMPLTPAITQTVLSPDGFTWDGQRLRRKPPAGPPPPWESRFLSVLHLIEELRRRCDEYFGIMEKDRATNYEDIAYLAHQVRDGLLSEYENPALYPLIRELEHAMQVGGNSLGELASDAAHYIADIVTHSLAPARVGFEPVLALVDCFRDASIARVDAFTLNHDLVMERALEQAAVPFSDGFERPFGTLRIWNDTLTGSRSLLHLHGAIDWWRYQLPRETGEREVVARPARDSDPHRPRGPSGESLDAPADERPLLLTGTFNKILSYPTSIHADQHVRLHQALRRAEILLVVGYGFGDKGINARLVSWLERPTPPKMVVVHPEPERLRQGARGAIRHSWHRWKQAQRVVTVERRLDVHLHWDEIRQALTP